MVKTIVVRDASRLPPLGEPVVGAIGNFDGVHLGHQALLGRVRDRVAGGGTGVAISFYPHPMVVLRRAERLPLLTTLRLKLQALGEAGVALLYLIHFTPRFSRRSADEFIEETLWGTLGLSHLVIGPDARVGVDRSGTAEYLVERFQRSGRSAEIVPFVQSGGETISSRRIRQLVSGGQVDEAARLLGRPFTLDSLVITGDRRGRQLGFPTANLKPNRQVTPERGVYATRTILNGTSWASVTNVGVRPTFGGERLAVETHLLEYTGPEFYGAEVEVAFIERLRGEQRFSGIEELKSQIGRDIAAARRILQPCGD